MVRLIFSTQNNRIKTPLFSANPECNSVKYENFSAGADELTETTVMFYGGLFFGILECYFGQIRFMPVGEWNTSFVHFCVSESNSPKKAEAE